MKGDWSKVIRELYTEIYVTYLCILNINVKFILCKE